MSEERTQKQVPIAIVGMGCIFPGAPDLAAFWQNLKSGKDAIEEVPPKRFEPFFYEPSSKAVDRVYCRRGGFIDAYARFDPLAFGIMPIAAEAAEPDQLLALRVASEALKDAGLDPGRLPTKRGAVILGRGGYMTAGVMRMTHQVRIAEQLSLALQDLLPGVSEAALAAVKCEFQSRVPSVGPDTAIGLVPNLAASRIANRFDLRGPAYTIDAACASSLLAVEHACRELGAGRVDLALAGGVHVTHEVGFWSVFCQLGAMSRREQIRPFDRRADGLLIGEGVGLVVLRRLEDALRDGGRIYAVIRGVGVSSDGRETSLMQPSVSGQVLSLERAWAESGLDPEELGFVEAHGTATPAGDQAELTSLAQVFGPVRENAPRAGLGSVKSMIGHLMPAAGAAGLIKAALALHHRTLLPSLHCEEPREALEATRFRIIDRAEPLEGSRPLAGVNAFGFGGINVHIVLQAAEATRPRQSHIEAGAALPRLLRLQAPDTAGLLALLDRLGPEAADFEARLSEGTPLGARLTVLEPTPDLIAKARKIVERGHRWPGRSGIWFTPSGMLQRGGAVAFLFPGVDASIALRIGDVAEHFHLSAPELPQAFDLERVGFAIIQVGRFFDQVLRRLGLKPTAIAGHSIGEWSAMIASGVIPEEAIDAFIADLRPGTLQVPGVAFAALGTGAAQALEAAADFPGVYLSHDNCPHQSILCGPLPHLEAIVLRLRGAGVMCQILPFQSGFHTPLLADYLGQHRAHFDRIPLRAARTPLWSATTCAPYPAEPEAMRALCLEHLVRPVRFRELIERLHADGIRAFVQVGAGSLSGFVEDSLKGREHLALSAGAADRAGLEQLRRLTAALWAEGALVDLAALWPRAQTASAASRPIQLELGVPLVRLEQRLDCVPAAPAPLGLDGDPVLQEFGALDRELHETRNAVLEAYLEQRADAGAQPPRAPAPREPVEAGPVAAPIEIRRRLSVQDVPALWDHALIPQAEGWQDAADLQPVVPMTMDIALMLGAALALAPDRVAVQVTRIRALRWLAVEPPVEVVLRAAHVGADLVRAEIAGYAECEIALADHYPAPPPAAFKPFANQAPVPLDARSLYSERWMFHGPAYQGIVELGPIGDDGIRGTIQVPPGPGALLDNAGQLFGYWVMARHELDRLAMPLSLERIELYGPEPRVGERVECEVRIRHVKEREVACDLELLHRGRVWCRILGWEDRRFETDPIVFAVMRQAGMHLLSRSHAGGFAWFDDQRCRAPSRDWLQRRYLNSAERAELRQQSPRRAREWLNGRIAAKDAVRMLLWKSNLQPIFPAELTVTSSGDAPPRLSGPMMDGLSLSLSHSGPIAVALAARGRRPGIDVERIEQRPTSFEEVSFTAAERALLPAEERDVWVTRLWSAKEALAKALGEGLGGRPKRFAASRIEAERILIEGAWIETAREGDTVVAWTEVE